MGVADAALAGLVVLDFGVGGVLQPPTFAPPYVEDGFRFSTINQPQPGGEQDHFVGIQGLILRGLDCACDRGT